MLSTRQACVLVGGMDRLVTDMLRSNRDARLAGRTALLGSWCAFERADGVVGIEVRIFGRADRPCRERHAPRRRGHARPGSRYAFGRANMPCQTELCFWRGD